MLLRRDGDAIHAIGQTSHAWISGQLARAWGNERFARPDPWEEVCLGAEQHDVAYAVADLDPELDDDGLPVDFYRVDPQARLRMWRDAPQRVVAQSRYAALLVAMHGIEIHTRHRPQDPSRAAVYDELVALLAAQRDELLASLQEDPARAARNRDLVYAWDALSLGVCLGWDELTVATPDGDVRLRDGRLQPWPFTPQRLTLRCDARRWGEAPHWESLAFELVP